MTRYRRPTAALDDLSDEAELRVRLTGEPLDRLAALDALDDRLGALHRLQIAHVLALAALGEPFDVALGALRANRAYRRVMDDRR